MVNFQDIFTNYDNNKYNILKTWLPQKKNEVNQWMSSHQQGILSHQWRNVQGKSCSQSLNWIKAERKPLNTHLLAEFYAFKAHKKVHFEWSGNNIGAEYSVIITSTHFTALNVTQIFIIKFFVWQMYKLVHHNHLFLVILEFLWSRAAYCLFCLSYWIFVLTSINFFYFLLIYSRL